MSEQDHSAHELPRAGGFWTSRTGMVLIAFLSVAGLLLAFEHRAHVFTGTGFLVALLALCVGMHFFMHGGHGGDGGGTGSADSGGRS